MTSDAAAAIPSQPGGTSLGHRLVANTAANFSGQVVLLALAFFATPYIVGRFGASRYGVLILVLSFVNVLALFQLGFNLGLVKYLSASIAANDSSESESYLRTALVLYLVIGIAVAVVLGFGADWLVLRFFHVPAALESEATAGLYLAAAAFAVRFVAEVFNSVPIAAQRFDIVNGLFAGSEIARIAGSVMVVWLGHFVRAVLAVAAGSSVLFLAGSVAATLWLLPGVRLWPSVSGKHLHDLVHFSKFAALSQLATRSGSLDGPILAHLVPAAYVTYYMVPYALCSKIRILAGNVASVTFPALSSLAAPADAGRLRELYLRGTKMVFALVALPSLALVLVSRAVLAEWIDPQFARHGALALGILSAGFLVNSLMHIPDTLTNSLGRPSVPAGFNTAETIAKYALFFALVPRFGIAGAAAGFLGTQIALAPWFIRAANRMVSVGWKELFLRAYLPAAAPLGASVFALALWRSHIGSLPGLMAGLFVVTSIYLLLGTVLILDRRDRAACLSLLKNRLLLASRFFRRRVAASPRIWQTQVEDSTQAAQAFSFAATSFGDLPRKANAAIDLTVRIANRNRAGGAHYFRKHSGRLTANAFLLHAKILRCWVPRWRMVLVQAARRVIRSGRRHWQLPGTTIRPAARERLPERNPFRVEEE